MILFLGFLSFLALLLMLFFFYLTAKPEHYEIQVSNENELKASSKEDSEGDGLFLFEPDDILFPPDFEDDWK